TLLALADSVDSSIKAPSPPSTRRCTAMRCSRRQTKDNYSGQKCSPHAEASKRLLLVPSRPSHRSSTRRRSDLLGSAHRPQLTPTSCCRRLLCCETAVATTVHGQGSASS